MQLGILTVVNLYILNSVQLNIKENMNSHTVVNDVRSHATRSGHNLVYPCCRLNKSLKYHANRGVKFFSHLQVRVRFAFFPLTNFSMH